MQGAIEEYKQGLERGVKLSVRFLSRQWKVPRATLVRRVNGKIIGSAHVAGRKPYLPAAAEEELSPLKTMAERGFPLTKSDVQQLAFQYARQNKIKGFSEKAGCAGHYWFRNFLLRNPGLRMRKPEVLSAARAIGLNQQVVSQWFNVYEELLHTLGLEGIPSHLWNGQDCRTSFHPAGWLAELDNPAWRCARGRRGRPPPVWQPSTQRESIAKQW